MPYFALWGFLESCGYFKSSSTLDWVFPWRKPSSYWGIPPFMDPPESFLITNHHSPSLTIMKAMKNLKTYWRYSPNPPLMETLNKNRFIMEKPSLGTASIYGKPPFWKSPSWNHHGDTLNWTVVSAWQTPPNHGDLFTIRNPSSNSWKPRLPSSWWLRRAGRSGSPQSPGDG